MQRIAVVLAAVVAVAVALDLNCPALPASPPATNVNQLHPSDFKMLFAAGDSITAGFAMHGKPTEYRQDVYAIGANEKANTIFNYIKFYSPAVVGGATGDTLPIDAGVPPETWLDLESDKCQLDGAISGAKVADVYHQVNYLAKQGRKYKTVNWETDWKLFTLFIGANDLCESCHGREDETPETYGQTIDAIVQQIYGSIPRVAVQLVSLFNISQVWDINKHSIYCRTVDREVDECGCLYDNKETRQAMDENSVQYNIQLSQVAHKWQSFNYTNFTVVYQPSFENTILTSDKYLSDLDCFHPSSLTDELIANGLWNAMWTPAAQKSHGVEPGVEPLCPTASSIFYTT